MNAAANTITMDLTGVSDSAGNAGIGIASSANYSIRIITAPGAPTGVIALAGDRQAIVRFTPPASDGGAAITSYTVTSNPGSITVTGTASPITVTGLTNGIAYTFTVTATNSKGTSTASAPSSSVTPQAPSSGGGYTSPPETTVYNAPSVPDATVWLSGSGLIQGDRLITQRVTSGSDYTAMLKLADKGDILRVFDISLRSGKKSFSGGIHLTFDVGREYAGQTITLVHKRADGIFEYFNAAVDAKGNVKFGPLYELSPFMLVRGRFVDSVLLRIPKTGDNSGAGLWIVTLGAALASVGLATWQRLRKRGNTCR